MSYTINIIGAGIGGLTAALALLRGGHRVCVFEQAQQLAEIGAGLTLTPNATRVIRYLGLARALDRIGSAPRRGAVLHWRTGGEIVENSRAGELAARYGAPYCQVHRADLQQELLRAVLAIDSCCVRLDARLVDLERLDDRVVASFADGREASADLMVGADGVHSRVRHLAFGADQPRFTGQVAWRGLLAADLLREVDLEPPSSLSIGPGRIFTRYLLRDGALVNYVAIVGGSEWQIESWSTPGDPADLLAQFAGWYATVRRIIAATPRGRLYKWALFDRPSLDRWSHARCTLLGDAAHPLLPFLGQGAAMAIEDACVLARVLHVGTDLEDALARYDTARIGRTTQVADASRSAGERFQQMETDTYTAATHVSAMSLDLPAYDATSVPL